MDEAGAALEDTLPCWKCQAPVRSSWPRCPGCKAEKEPPADLDSEAAASELSSSGLDPAFISECWRCSAPVKLSWSVCPGCKVRAVETKLFCVLV